MIYRITGKHAKILRHPQSVMQFVGAFVFIEISVVEYLDNVRK